MLMMMMNRAFSTIHWHKNVSSNSNYEIVDIFKKQKDSINIIDLQASATTLQGSNSI